MVKRISGATFGHDRGHPDAAAPHIGQLRAFVEGSEAVDLQPYDRADAYGFARNTLERFACDDQEHEDSPWIAERTPPRGCALWRKPSACVKCA